MGLINISDFIDNYDLIENKSLHKYPINLTSAFSPITFHKYGFQTDIKNQDELWKFIDTQHEGRYFANLALLNGGLTQSEFELFQIAVDICIKFTKTINKESIPLMALTRSLLSYRAINSFYKSSGKIPSVLEIGPGSGYLGLLCGISGWRYSSFDNTKSLVVYQNALWNFAGLKVKFAEKNGGGGVNYSDSDFLQIPWWVWCDREYTIPKRELIVANHVIMEMSPLALNFTIQRIKNLGAEYITAESFGSGEFPENRGIIANNTVLVHTTQQDNTRKENNYMRVWIWKIINNGVNNSNNFDLTYSIIKSEASTIIKIIRKLRVPGKLYRKIASRRSIRSLNSKSKELLHESMLHPEITIGANALQKYLSFKARPLITEDELIARWCNHITTNGRTVESLSPKRS